MASRCEALRRDGQPCTAKPVPGSTLCPWHHPTWAERRREWSVRGVMARATRREPGSRFPDGVLSIDELRGLLGTALKDVLAGTLQPGPANAAAALARSYLAATEASASRRWNATSPRGGSCWPDAGSPDADHPGPAAAGCGPRPGAVGAARGAAYGRTDGRTAGHGVGRLAARAVHAEARQVLLNVSRQGGKSTVAALLGLRELLRCPTAGS